MRAGLEGDVWVDRNDVQNAGPRRLMRTRFQKDARYADTLGPGQEEQKPQRKTKSGSSMMKQIC